MDKKTIILIFVIFALIIIGMFTFAHLKQKEVNQNLSTPIEEPALTVPYPGITRIEAKHYFDNKNKHTFAGEILMPTPCDLLINEVRVQESFPEKVTLEFSVINNSEVCAEVITPQRFLIPVSASAEAEFRSTFMGREVELNLIPAQAGEVPEDFELFIKG